MNGPVRTAGQVGWALIVLGLIGTVLALDLVPGGDQVRTGSRLLRSRADRGSDDH